MWDSIPYYQINTGMAIIMTISLTGLAALMVILRPRTLLNQLAMWFALVCSACMWRYCAALLNAPVFGVKESLIASIFFGVATIVTTVFACVAWREHVGDMLDHRRKRKNWKE